MAVDPEGEHIRAIEKEAASHGISFEEMMDAAKAHRETGEYLVEGGRFEGECVSEEFWDHYDIVTNTTGDRGSFFSCAC
jgi:hypothetical protein